MNQLAQDLRAARALIDTPEKWNKSGTSATNEAGTGVPACSDGACCFCVFGGIRRAVSADWTRENACLCSLYAAIGFSDDPARLFRWNDAPERTHSEVMAAFDKAIEKAEAQP